MPGIAMDLSFNDNVGATIPSDTPHGVSVSLPTWRSNVGYEEGESWVIDKMETGYPRFFIHKSIERLAQCIVKRYGSPGVAEKAMLFPSPRSAARCADFILKGSSQTNPCDVRQIDFGPAPNDDKTVKSPHIEPRVSAILYPEQLWPVAKAYWQHTGDGISSRRAEFCQSALDENILIDLGRRASPACGARLTKGPRRYQRPMSVDGVSPTESQKPSLDQGETGTNGASVVDSVQFVEERFGRNLHVAFTNQAKLAIRKRIAGSLTTPSELPASLHEPADASHDRARDVPGFSVDDVYLFSCGMNAIFSSHRVLRRMHDDRKSIMFGFPYVDTLKILEKFGAGAAFYGMGDESDLDDIEQRLESGERFLSLYCEFPGNPLLKTPNLRRIRALADKYDFAVVIDETIGNFVNVHVLPYADIVVSSLTKVFSGDSNVMGGSLILRPSSRYYSSLKHILENEYEDDQFGEDSVYLERNSRDFVSRSQRINSNAEVVADTLRSCPEIVKQVNYPKYSDTKHHFDACRVPGGGYGGLLSATFHRLDDAKVFFDHLNTQKGPSLGTNFTLSSPFVLLAHYKELDWAAEFGCDQSLVRFSVGLEDTQTLKTKFEDALAAVKCCT